MEIKLLLKPAPGGQLRNCNHINFLVSVRLADLLFILSLIIMKFSL